MSCPVSIDRLMILSSISVMFITCFSFQLAAQMPAQNVFKDIGSEIADMDIVVDRWSARIHADGGSIHGE